MVCRGFAWIDDAENLSSIFCFPEEFDEEEKLRKLSDGLATQQGKSSRIRWTGLLSPAFLWQERGIGEGDRGQGAKMTPFWPHSQLHLDLANSKTMNIRVFKFEIWDYLGLSVLKQPQQRNSKKSSILPILQTTPAENRKKEENDAVLKQPQQSLSKKSSFLRKIEATPAQLMKKKIFLGLFKQPQHSFGKSDVFFGIFKQPQQSFGKSDVFFGLFKQPQHSFLKSDVFFGFFKQPQQSFRKKKNSKKWFCEKSWANPSRDRRFLDQNSHEVTPA